MPKEKETYADNLAMIAECFPGKRVLNKKEVIQFTGLSRETVNKIYPFNEFNYISVATLARCLSSKEKVKI
nr:MAG TPA: DNR protein [Caudoviricetes sp.]